MIAFAAELPPQVVIYRTLSEASGSEGQLVEKQLQDVQAGFDDSIAQNGNRLRALAALDAFYRLASRENWDGEAGLPVDRRAYANARRLLAQTPTGWPSPEINADPDGEISFEWSSGPRRRFSVSIGSEEQISYAWILGAERGHSVNTFVAEIPRQFLGHVERILGRS